MATRQTIPPSRCTPVQGTPMRSDRPLVSVLIPARNEAHNIARCVNSLRAQAGVELEIIVVDDQSTDGTAEVIRGLATDDARVRLCRVTRLPEGWLGKPHALHAGLRSARGTWVLMTDADTYHYPDTLATALDQATTQTLACLSYSPEQECGTFGERLLQPGVFQLLREWFPFRQAQADSHSGAAANGQFLLIRRAVLEAVGGIRSVRNQVLDDVELACRVTAAGFRMTFTCGRRLVRTRMYRSLGECWRGWAKNLYPLCCRAGDSLLAFSGRTLTLDILPAVALLVLGTGFLLLGEPELLVPAAGCASWLAGRMLWLGYCWQSLGFPARHAWYAPLTGLLLITLLWYSFYRHMVRGTVEWKDREYRLADRSHERSMPHGTPAAHNRRSHGSPHRS